MLVNDRELQAARERVLEEVARRARVIPGGERITPARVALFIVSLDHDRNRSFDPRERAILDELNPERSLPEGLPTLSFRPFLGEGGGEIIHPPPTKSGDLREIIELRHRVNAIDYHATGLVDRLGQRLGEAEAKIVDLEARLDEMGTEIAKLGKRRSA